MKIKQILKPTKGKIGTAILLGIFLFVISIALDRLFCRNFICIPSIFDYTFFVFNPFIYLIPLCFVGCGYILFLGVLSYFIWAYILVVILLLIKKIKNKKFLFILLFVVILILGLVFIRKFLVENKECNLIEHNIIQWKFRGKTFKENENRCLAVYSNNNYDVQVYIYKDMQRLGYNDTNQYINDQNERNISAIKIENQMIFFSNDYLAVYEWVSENHPITVQFLHDDFQTNTFGEEYIIAKEYLKLYPSDIK